MRLMTKCQVRRIVFYWSMKAHSVKMQSFGVSSADGQFLVCEGLKWKRQEANGESFYDLKESYPLGIAEIELLGNREFDVVASLSKDKRNYYYLCILKHADIPCSLRWIAATKKKGEWFEKRARYARVLASEIFSDNFTINCFQSSIPRTVKSKTQSKTEEMQQKESRKALGKVALRVSSGPKVDKISGILNKQRIKSKGYRRREMKLSNHLDVDCEWDEENFLADERALIAHQMNHLDDDKSSYTFQKYVEKVQQYVHKTNAAQNSTCPLSAKLDFDLENLENLASAVDAGTGSTYMVAGMVGSELFSNTSWDFGIPQQVENATVREVTVDLDQVRKRIGCSST